MDRFVKGKRKAIDEVAQTQAGAVHSKAKCRKYDWAYAFLLSALGGCQILFIGLKGGTTKKVWEPLE